MHLHQNIEDQSCYLKIDYQIPRKHSYLTYFEVESSIAQFLCHFAFPIFKRLVSAIFTKFLFFHQMIALKNYEKCFLFHLKSSFRSRDIQIFVFPAFPLFLPVGHCFGG